MKKYCGMVIALLLCVLLALTGCGVDGAKVFTYLKAEQNFVGNPGYNGGNYTVSFTVNDDLSYSFHIADMKSGNAALKDYSAEGTQMEYLGRRERKYESTSWGITHRWTVYTHVIKLPEATVTDDDIALTFYLLAECESKNADEFLLKLVTARSTYGKSDIENIGTDFHAGYAMKLAEPA